MGRVEIYRLKAGGAQEVIAEFHLVDNQAIGRGNEKLVERLETQGIVDKTTKPPIKVFPADGHRFLELLNTHFTTGYLTASEIIEDPSHEE